MDFGATELFMLVGFLLAAYSIVANDAIQTLGTFLSSNAERPWWVLWLYACSILTVVVIYGWIVNGGDPAYGRLEKFPEPDGHINWFHCIPPIILLILTRFGIPVSTTFLVLTVFAPTNLSSMLEKSLLGYAVAIVVGLVLFAAISRFVEKQFMDTRDTEPGFGWVLFQWASTAFLWSQWLIQDLANIFVYLPRTVGFELVLMALVVMLALHAIIFKNRGGRIQGIVLSKTNTTDIRAASFIDISYGLVLMVFKEMSNIPMSTTWVFLGMLAGREIALALMLNHRRVGEAAKNAGSDLAKAGVGLAISVALALGLPPLSSWIAGGDSAQTHTKSQADSQPVPRQTPRHLDPALATTGLLGPQQ
ncbi:MAG: hypothetical protein AAF918_14610 [Pseudomonadota bacterium]